MRESEDRYRTLFDQLGDSVLLLRLDGGVPVIVDANEAALKVHGYSREEMVGQPISLLEPGISAAMVEDRRRLLAEQKSIYMFHTRKDGSRFEVESVSRWTRIGAQNVVLTVERDITEHKRAQEELRLSRQWQALHVQQTPLAVIEFDLDGRIRAWNPAAVAIFGFSPEEAIGQHWTFMVPRSVWGALEGVWEGLVSQRGGSRSTNGNTTKDGRTISCEWFNTSLVDASGKTFGVASLVMDVTERKRAEEEREKLQLQLAQSRKMESIGRLAGGVAHDFNNLLTVINGYSDLMLKRLREGDPLRTTVGEIRLAGRRAAELTRQLLAFSRKQVIEPRPVNLNHLIDETRDMLQRLVGEDVSLVTELDAALGVVMADPGHLHQVLMNLTVNARDAMRGCGRLTIQTANAELDQGYAAAHPGVTPGSYVRLTVSDTGAGMDEEIRQSIFEPFFTTKGVGEGTGLGLSTVYGIVRQIGGWIWVDSEPGQGATFRIDLPRAEHAPGEEESPAAQPATLRGTETVLVVEDQAEVRRLAVAVLAECGYQVLEAGGGKEALEVAGGHAGPIDLLLTDVVMPRMTGRELAGRLAPLRPRMKVLYMSGYTENVIAHQGMLDSGVNYLAKPFVPEGLARKVREVLGVSHTAGSILVVDDDEGIRSLFREILEGAGHQVEVTRDGGEAMQMARRTKFDVVVTDLVMPGREGIETIQALRREQPGVKIVAVSGAFGGAVLKAAGALGADATLLKPVSSSDLLDAVRTMLA